MWNEIVLGATDPARNASSPEAIEAAFWVMYPGLPDPVYAYLQQAAHIAGSKAGPAGGGGVPVLRVMPTADAAAAGGRLVDQRDAEAGRRFAVAASERRPTACVLVCNRARLVLQPRCNSDAMEDFWHCSRLFFAAIRPLR